MKDREAKESYKEGRERSLEKEVNEKIIIKEEPRKLEQRKKDARRR